MGVISVDLGALTTARAKKFWIAVAKPLILVMQLRPLHTGWASMFVK